MKKILILLLFLNACSSSPSINQLYHDGQLTEDEYLLLAKNEETGIIFEKGTKNKSYRYDIDDDQLTDFEMQGCQLICIGERNFYNSRINYPRKRDYTPNLVNLYEKLFDENKNISTYNNLCKIESKRIETKDQLICAKGGKQYLGNNTFLGGTTMCFPYNKFESEDSEIKRVVKLCDDQALEIIKSSNTRREKRKKQFQKDYTNRLISFCNNIGFKAGTESNGNCVLRILDTQRELNEEKVISSSTKIIIEKENSLTDSLLLMQMGLNLMNPPKPKLNCSTNLFGWTCY